MGITHAFHNMTPMRRPTGIVLLSIILMMLAAGLAEAASEDPTIADRDRKCAILDLGFQTHITHPNHHPMAQASWLAHRAFFKCPIMLEDEARWRREQPHTWLLDGRIINYLNSR